MCWIERLEFDKLNVLIKVLPRKSRLTVHAISWPRPFQETLREDR